MSRMEDMKTLGNWDVRERLKINKCKAHRLLKKFGRRVGGYYVISEKTLERLISNGEIYFDKGGRVYF